VLPVAQKIRYSVAFYPKKDVAFKFQEIECACSIKKKKTYQSSQLSLTFTPTLPGEGCGEVGKKRFQEKQNKIFLISNY